MFLKNQTGQDSGPGPRPLPLLCSYVERCCLRGVFCHLQHSKDPLEGQDVPGPGGLTHVASTA